MSRTHRGAALGVALLLTLAVLLLGPAPAPGAEPDVSTAGVDVAAIPEQARAALDEIVDLTATHCPELPPAWVVAQIDAESGWDPHLRTGDAVGLLQLSERTWRAAGGKAWPDPDLTDPAAHLRIGVPWLCATMRAVAGHLATADMPVSVLDATLVCHIAGCRRVTESATGIPAPGEAGCSEACSGAVRRYLDAVHRRLAEYSATGTPAAAAPETAAPDDREGSAAPKPGARTREPDAAQERAVTPQRGTAGGRDTTAGAPQQRPSASAPAAAPAAAWTGGRTACAPPDPTRSGGCLTGATRHGLNAAKKVFGALDDGPVISKAGCWDEHAWNPSSDHPKGRACDLFPGAAGTFPKGRNLENGWQVARWFQRNAGPLKVRYLIWQGRYWDPSVTGDGSGWGRRYTGGGVYDTGDPTGGHYDHVHVSFEE